ncbi:MAG TPA: hypothetical protein VHN36_05755 [Ilumatobacteraceae bacterium]|nr:hypothetical protein [Ilumatobacteraceae bacterium]
MPELKMVSTLPATPTLPAVATLPATATLPAVAALPATATLPAVATLPATATLPAVAELPATATLPTVAALPATAVLPNVLVTPEASRRALDRFFTYEVSRGATLPTESPAGADGRHLQVDRCARRRASGRLATAQNDDNGTCANGERDRSE